MVSPRAYARLQDRVVAESLGTFDLKGFSRPIEAYAVTGMASDRPT